MPWSSLAILLPILHLLWSQSRRRVCKIAHPLAEKAMSAPATMGRPLQHTKAEGSAFNGLASWQQCDAEHMLVVQVKFAACGLGPLG